MPVGQRLSVDSYTSQSCHSMIQWPCTVSDVHTMRTGAWKNWTVWCTSHKKIKHLLVIEANEFMAFRLSTSLLWLVSVPSVLCSQCSRETSLSVECMTTSKCHDKITAIYLRLWFVQCAVRQCTSLVYKDSSGRQATEQAVPVAERRTKIPESNNCIISTRQQSESRVKLNV